DVGYSLAEEQDFQDDYSGLDYMAATFHRWLQEPGRLVFIAKMNSRVALESALLVDGGHTVVFQGFRVAPDLRGSGIAGGLQEHVTNYIRRHYPEVSVVRRSRGDQPSAESLAKYRLIAKEVGPRRQTLGSTFTLQHKDLTQSSPHGPVILTQPQAETLILSNHVVYDLLPGKTIINNWEPLKPMEANLEVLRRRGLTWIVDHEVDPSVVSLSTPPYAVPYRHDALHFNINIFGHSLISVCTVFLAQLEALLPSLRGYLIVYTHVDPQIWPGLRQFCQNKANVSFFKAYCEDVVLESDLRCTSAL
uniref:Histidine N-acetyltransferase-like n=1 Tax=Mastacembelus armatus TaxID=205130 RepID=A0A7N8XEP1_9TELE